MKKKKIIILKILAINLFVLLAVNTYALEKRPTQILFLFGLDVQANEKATKPIFPHTIAPPLMFSYINYFDNVNMYLDLILTTNYFFVDVGYEKGNIKTGIKPFFGWLVHGGFTAYVKGVNYGSLTFRTNRVGSELYFKYTLAKMFSTQISYTPVYYLYQKMKSDSALDHYDTSIDLPDNHFENHISLDLTLNRIKKIDKLGIIKHGFLVGFNYQYLNRVNYGSFVDPFNSETSDIEHSHKMYLILGGYYRLPLDFTLNLDFIGSWQEDVDRNNGDKIGGFFTLKDYPGMPGFYLKEFYHDRFIITKFNVGIPAKVWDLRFAPGFNLLYMPKENRVVGVPDYSKEVYMSVSLETSMKIANKVPFFVNYAYGINAQREDTLGNHEVTFYVVMGFLPTGKAKE